MSESRRVASGPRGVRRALGVRGALVALLLALLAASSPAAAGHQLDDARDEVEELDEELDELRDEVQDDEAAEERLAGLLAAASTRLEGAEDELDAATRAEEVAEREREHARGEVADARAILAASRDEAGDVAADLYRLGPQFSTTPLTGLATVPGADPGEAVRGAAVLEHVLGDRAVAVQDSTATVARVAAAEERAADAEERLERERSRAESAEDAAAAAHAELLDALSQAQERTRDRRDRIADLEAERDATQARIEELEAAAAQPAARGGGGGSGGGGPVSSAPAGGGLANVGGITVSSAIAGQLQGLLQAARADGIVLGGNGYRSPEVTAQLRIANGCPDVHSSPASSCRIPTARPGTSSHERGLAVDFTWNGQTICYPRGAASCGGNAAFDWLAANAGRFGFRVLSSEAWHWSTDGT